MTVLYTCSLKCAPYVAGHLLTQPGPRVRHGQQDTLDLELRIQSGLNAPHRRHQLGQPLEREVLAVERYQHRMRRHERIQGQQPQRRGRVDEDVVMPLDGRTQQRAQPTLSLGQSDQLDFGAGQMMVGRNQPQAGDRRVQLELLRGDAVRRQRMVDGASMGDPRPEPETTREIRLRIEIDQEYLLVAHRQRCREIDGRGRLADAALLIGDCDNPAHWQPVLWSVECLNSTLRRSALPDRNADAWVPSKSMALRAIPESVERIAL